MLFNSISFLIFLPIVFAGYWLLNNPWRNLFLLAASYYFYFCYNPYFLILLFATSGFDYWCARQIQNKQQKATKKLFVTLSVAANISVLFIFKYFIFFYNTSLSLFSNNPNVLANLIIPAGLSFYTFQSISYTIDVYRNKYKATDSLSDFLLYVSFFPHMVAGPIVRYHSLMPQLKVTQLFKNIEWESFAKLTIWGFFKKMVIADNLSNIVTPVFNNVENFSGSTLLFTGFLFAIQVYSDFSGYSDIATGISKLFGIDLSLNWRRPLLSKSLHEFWTRNHISITTWFKDYLYISLGGNRVSYNHWLTNIFLVFVISGLWHGANFTFIVWGAMHGIFYIGEILVLKQYPNFKAPKLMGWFYLILFHTITIIAFRAISVNDLWIIYHKIVTDFNPSNFYQESINIKGVFYFMICIGVILFMFTKELNEEYSVINHLKNYNHFLKPGLYILILISIFLIGNFNANPFIYFQF